MPLSDFEYLRNDTKETQLQRDTNRNLQTHTHTHPTQQRNVEWPWAKVSKIFNDTKRRVGSAEAAELLVKTCGHNGRHDMQYSYTFKNALIRLDL